MEVVVSFRALSSDGFALQVRALEERARAAKGRLVAFHAREVAFAFPALSDALAVAAGAVHEQWAIAIAEGELETMFGELAWGVPLDTARLLVAVTDPGDVLCAESVKAMRSGELLSNGSRIARTNDRRVRGHRLDIERPWKKQAVEQLSHMRVAPLVGVEPLTEAVQPGQLLLIRADPGAGGSRFLGELAAATPRALMVTPSGSGFEPFGALRRALARSITRELNPKLLELAVPFEKLLAGETVPMDVATKLVTAFMWPRTVGEIGLLVIDEVRSIDPSTLDACVRAARSPTSSFGICARVDGATSIPAMLAMLPLAGEKELTALASDAAEALAAGCTNDALDRPARRRWARLGGNVPLGIIESVSWGIQSGDIVWRGDVASPRTRAAGRGKTRAPAEWIALRAREQTMPARIVLCLVALLGGEAKTSRLVTILAKWAQGWDVEEVIQSLIAERWLFDTQEDWVGLPSRTHCAALSVILDDNTRIPLHAAAAIVLEQEEGAFGRVEAAWHAARSKDIGHSSKLLLEAANETASARLDTSTTQLIALARRIDPSCEDAALELLGASLEKFESRTSIRPAPIVSAPPEDAAMVPSPPAPEVAPIVDTDPVLVIAEDDDLGPDSEPPTLARPEAASSPSLPPPAPLPSFMPPSSGAVMTTRSDSSPPPPPSEGANLAQRLGELARDALLTADNAALERWVDDLRASGEDPILADRMTAMARLGQGDIGDALRVLRRTRSKLDPNDHKRRCQTSLSLGVALSLAGRMDEALLEGLDALGRARFIEDEHGARACLAFLAKLYRSTGRDPESDRLRASSPLAPPATP